MFRNYFKIAARNLWRNKVFSTINIFGLALGIATCLLILLFVQNELSYDKYNKNADRLVRVSFRGSMQGGVIKEASVMAPVANTLKRDYPEVEEATRMRTIGQQELSYGGKTFKENGFLFVDSNFFQMFTLPLLQGNARIALLQPNSMVISKAIAQKYFGNENPVGKSMDITGGNSPLRITGLIDAVPRNSHFHGDFFVSMSTMPDARNEDWMSSNYYTYLQLRKGSDIKKLEAKLPQVIEKYIGPQLEKGMGVTLAQFRQSGNQIGLYLQPVTDIHLHADLTNDLEPYGDIRYVYIFSAVAIFMLLIACVNFMNLSTASASKRAREVGIRKVMGSVKTQLIGQFLLESVLLTMIAMLVSLCIVYMALPVFNQLAGQNLSLDLKSSPWLLPGLALFGLFTGLMAGSYPAFFLSSFNPITVLKGKFSTGKKSTNLRNGLVVFQFFVSISLIVGTIVVYKQLSFIQHKKLGYDTAQTMVIEHTYRLGDKQSAYRQQLLRDPRILNVTASGFIPAGPSNNNNFFIYPDDQSAQLVKTLRYEVDDQYLPTMGIQLAGGRNFSPAYGSDSTGILINETAARTFGWNDQALGHTLSHTEKEGNIITYKVIGIVKDFNFRSLHEAVTPLVMTLGTDYGTMIARIKTNNIPLLISNMQQQWAAMVKGEPLSYSFLDERVMNSYKSERNTGLILGVFAALTIFVACLGLFGLATFTTNQRTREIGIRKVLGADVKGIVSMLSGQFLKLVGIAFIIAAPLMWLVMNRWLEDFAYRITIGWLVFLVAAGLVITLTIITVSFQAIKAALANPVKSLRTE